MPKPLNIILLMTDTYRFDNLGERAELPIRTPHLDRFAHERATEVTNFYTGSFPTIPNRTDLISGRLGWPWYPWQSLAKSTQNAWPKMLRNQGYATQLICDCPHLFNTDFQDAFMGAYQERGQEGDVPLLHLNDQIREVQPLAKCRPGAPLQPLAKHLGDQHRWTNRYYQFEDETFCYRTASTTVRWLEENCRARPFFLWVDFFDPHEPWDPPEYLVRHYQKAYRGTPMIHPNYGRSDDFTPAELANLRAHYAAEAELVDRSLGRIFQKLDDLQLWDSSLVVVTSDHGFSIGEHARVGKTNINPRDERAWPLYPEVSHVPFLIAGQGIPKGRSRDFIAQAQDILPTLSELAGVGVDLPEDIHGRSFKDALKGRASTHREVAIAASFGQLGENGFRPEATTPFVSDGEWGCTPHGPGGGVELFHLAEDPGATRNLAADYPSEVRRLGAGFLAELAAVGAPADVQAQHRQALGLG